MVDDWIDHIELRRDARANFSVWGNKYGEDPVSGSRRWFDWDKVKGLKSPMEIWQAIEDEADFLGVTVEWVDTVPIITSIDWLTAAVIATKLGFEIPALPKIEELLAQRSLRAVGRVTIGAEWGYDMHELSLPFERWVRILLGESFSLDHPYWYEGQRYTGTWSFDGARRLVVGIDEGGVGWEGRLADLNGIDGPKVDGVDLARLAMSAVGKEK